MKTTEIKTIKGFDKDLKCRDFQYEIGKSYHHEGKVEICNSGFHAINNQESPFNVFDFYPPATSRYCAVELSGEMQIGDDKMVASDITIDREIKIEDIVYAHIDWVEKNIIDDKSAATNTGEYSAAKVSGKNSVAMATGRYGKVSGALGCAIVSVERGDWDGTSYPIKSVCSAIVDGKIIKPDTWYICKNGKFVEYK